MMKIVWNLKEIWTNIPKKVRPFYSFTSYKSPRLVWPNPTRFSRFWVQFSGSNGSNRPSGSPKGSNWVGLTSKRVQIRVQSYNILNKSDLNPTRFWVGLGPQGQKLGWVGWGWPSGSKFWSNFGRVGRVHLAALKRSDSLIITKKGIFKEACFRLSISSLWKKMAPLTQWLLGTSKIVDCLT